MTTHTPSLDHIPRLRRPTPPPIPSVTGIAVKAARPELSRLSRRGLLFDEGGKGVGSSLRKLPGGAPAPADSIMALVQRITQGFSLSEYQRARAMGYDAYLEEQLDHLSIDDSAMDARLVNFPTLGMSPKQLIETYPEDNYIPFYELKGAAIVRSVHSKRQLFERMCEFWSDHFSIDHQKDPMWAFKQDDDRDVIRPYALSSFPELLSASAHSGAMMYYLDNWLNFAGAAQENYARELMELHTLGVDGGFTEQDVKEVARCFTGWTLNFDTESPDYLRFRFEAGVHDPGFKSVLGQLIAANTYQTGGELVLSILSGHPSTARFISTKLTRWLLAENPPQSVIDAVTQTYVVTGGDIKAMIRVILAEESVVGASRALAPKFRRPFHFVTSILRGLDADVYDPIFLSYYLALMGHSPFDWHPPNGYPDSVYVWGSSILPRWTFVSNLMSGFVPGVQVALGDVLGLLGNFESERIATRINRRILGRALAPDKVVRVQEFFDARGPLIWPEVFEGIALAASAPGYQWY